MNVLEGAVSVREVLNYLHTDRYLSKAETAHYLAISNRTFEGPDIPGFRVGSKRLWKCSELDRWVAAHREAPKDLEVIVEKCLEGLVQWRGRSRADLLFQTIVIQNVDNLHSQRRMMDRINPVHDRQFEFAR